MQGEPQPQEVETRSKPFAIKIDFHRTDSRAGTGRQRCTKHNVRERNFNREVKSLFPSPWQPLITTTTVADSHLDVCSPVAATTSEDGESSGVQKVDIISQKPLCQQTGSPG